MCGSLRKQCYSLKKSNIMNKIQGVGTRPPKPRDAGLLTGASF